MKRAAATGLALAVAVLTGAFTTFAQHHAGGHGPGPTPEGGAHHELVQAYEKAFAENVAAGRGFGMAFAADQNGYPGPLHVLELKDRLNLTADQEARVRSLLAAMFAESTPRGARLLESEARLRGLFAGGRADEASVRAAVAEVERARADVRLVHLGFHLKTRDVLTDDQRRVYHEARWGEGGSMRQRDGGGHRGHAPGK